MQHKMIYSVVFIALIAVFALFYRALPSSFIPSEDQGTLNIQFSLQNGAPMAKSQQVGEEIQRYFLSKEQENVELVLIRYGRNFSGTGQNLGQGFIALKHWDDRPGQENSAQAIRERATKYFSNNPDARIMVNMPGAVRGLGQTDGLEFWIRDINGQGRTYLEQQFKSLQTKTNRYDSFQNLDKS